MTEATYDQNSPPVRRYGHRIYDLAERIVKSAIRSLRDTDQPMISYIWRAWLIALIPSLIISALLIFVFELPGKPGPGPGRPPTFWVVILLVISPWGETLIMGAVLQVLKVLRDRLLVALASAWIWGYFHSLLGPGWGYTAAWGFFIYSVCFLEWEQKSVGKAIIATALVHTCKNAVPALLVVILWFLHG